MSVVFDVEFLNLGQTEKHFNRPVNTEESGIDGDVIVLRFSPFSVRVTEIVVSAFLVRGGNHFHGRRFIHIFQLHNPGNSRFDGCMDEHVNGVGPTGENVVRTAADDDGRSFGGNVSDDLRLRNENGL